MKGDNAPWMPERKPRQSPFPWMNQGDCYDSIPVPARPQSHEGTSPATTPVLPSGVHVEVDKRHP